MDTDGESKCKHGYLHTLKSALISIRYISGPCKNVVLCKKINIYYIQWTRYYCASFSYQQLMNAAQMITAALMLHVIDINLFVEERLQTVVIMISLKLRH